MDKLFSGMNGFFWWFGMVEDNNDPLMLGRVRVRIVGWHNEDPEVLPTDTLPWAYPILPTTNSGVGGTGISPNGMIIGTRVFGFFTDGDIGQSPVVLGTIPGNGVSDIKTGSGTQEQITRTGQNTITDVLYGTTTTEGPCAEGSADTTYTQGNIDFASQKFSIDASEWVVPFTGFISDPYGKKSGRNHRGVDICPGYLPQDSSGAPHVHGKWKGKTGLPVCAAADGEVVHIFTSDRGQRGIKSDYDRTGIKDSRRSFGNAIAIRHTLSSGTFTTVYAHLGVNQDPAKDRPGQGINVKVGEKVSKGQIIGTVGRSHVWDSLTHLHFEIRRGTALPPAGNHIDPCTIFPQMTNRDNSMRGVCSALNWNSNPPYSEKNMPCILGKGPKK